MKSKTPPPARPSAQNPAEIAREAFSKLAARRIAPTPDAYREAYDEIAGSTARPNAEQVLLDFATSLVGLKSQLDDIRLFGKRFDSAAKARDWPAYSKTLGELTTAHLTTLPVAAPAPLPMAVIAAAVAPARGALIDDQQPRILRDLLARTLLLAVAALLNTAPELAAEAEALGRAVRDALTDDKLNDISVRLKQLCFKIEMRAGDAAEEQDLLLRLFRLLLENVSELTEEDSWLHGQVEGVQHLLSGPINHHALLDATRSMKDVIYKQGMLKHSLTEAKITVKNMMITFVDRLSALAASTGDYHEKIEVYSRQITQAPNITTLNKILEDVMRDTRNTQSEALRSRDEMIVARTEVQAAEHRILELEAKLESMSELVREDQLTGSLNRRGLDDVFERELARADRRKSPLCIAMLDLDDFKRLNDTHGHVAGDEALVYLVRVIKDTLRTMDVLARFGGEEFLILLPDTTIEDATLTVTRLQRELTKRIFMHNNERLLITFSAGVAVRVGTEDQTSLIQRADAALYKAKRAGKNRVVSAE
ncbi:diguanylate cyclase [Actimicrobium sp. GrIS 1.19]|uniref:GGDEF domain-containing protein n=1 Tax=Actimicrobium sp. GrIS 1.19 TaxID=3071708 RepID=UPI002E089C54|nr:diguanylate cyclase [Actimicrobium sp. GrIS 1.19]